MRILHAILSTEFAGSEAYCCQLASLQAKAGDAVLVLVRDGDGPLVALSLPLEADTWLPEADLELAERCWRSGEPEQTPAPEHETTPTLVAIPVKAGSDVA